MQDAARDQVALAKMCCHFAQGRVEALSPVLTLRRHERCPLDALEEVEQRGFQHRRDLITVPSRDSRFSRSSRLISAQSISVSLATSFLGQVAFRPDAAKV